MKSLNSTGGEECSTNRLVFSSSRPALEEFETTEILLQSQPHPPNQRVVLTQDRHCAPSLDLIDLFHPILNHFHHLYHLLLHLQISLNLSLSLSYQVMDL